MAVHILPVRFIRRPPDRPACAGHPAPCPFCGNFRLVKIWADDPDGDGEGSDARVHCGDCMAEGPITDSVPNAVHAWNTRREVCRGE
jgi:Lar family restriction alleviation protein